MPFQVICPPIYMIPCLTHFGIPERQVMQIDAVRQRTLDSMTNKRTMILRSNQRKFCVFQLANLQISLQDRSGGQS